MKTLLTDFDTFLDAVRDALPDSTHAGAKPGAKTVRGLAEAIGATDAQTREWFVYRKYIPAGPVAFKALAWLQSQPGQRGPGYVKAPAKPLRKSSKKS